MAGKTSEMSKLLRKKSRSNRVAYSGRVAAFSIGLVLLGFGLAIYTFVGASISARSAQLLLISSIVLQIAGVLLWSVLKRAKVLNSKANELNASQDRLREVSEFRQQFLANMSHEFRTPLNAIQGFAQAILHRQHEMSPEQIADYIRIIEKAAHDLGTLTDNVLDLSQLDSTDFKITPTDTDFTRLVCDTVGRHSALASERDIKLNTVIEDDWIVRADPRGIKRCIDSLLSNAVKFSADGNDIDVSVYRWGRRSFVVEVKDRGCGISKRDLDNIWMVYARSSLTKKTDQIGAGLGLAITRAIMEAHGGYIEIESTEGTGTTVRLGLPNTMIVNHSYEETEREMPRRAAAR